MHYDRNSHHPISPKPPPPPHHQNPLSLQTHVSPVYSVKGSGYLSTIGQAITEEEEYRKARAQVLRKGVDLEGYTIEGVSIGGHETCVIVPELKCAFDIGRCPSRAIQQNFVFITHAHLDHIVSSSTVLPLEYPLLMFTFWMDTECPLLI
jgi:ribonuclease Z